MMSQKSPSISTAKEWLIENPSETVAVAARLHHLKPSSLYASIARGKEKTPKQHGG